MQVSLLAIGTRMPKWIDDGYDEYAKRLGREDSTAVCKKEGELLLAALPKSAYVIALDEHGKLQSTQTVADKFQKLRETSQPLALLVGGADGLSDQVLQHCDEKWSLSRLTFPHALVRVIVAEQIYRSLSLLNNHPYHRA